ncbi:hypothetical protein FH608_046240 [Nonomuraea phyllanthi]|uniref:Uncharacterized protein n=1 Tax=Nonomuraea phyllanthi TaxID=2219224 RepID=A0A5C4V7B6_9ACTN|nr:hypothetical protein [Nonomuraea phyllanthi]KAB8186895.1 hypothetical protein FH608_046240 [Nonomuraea phyllanthi]
MKVYLATSGAYSDYEIDHVFARREDAEAYELADRVEEFELHEGPVETRVWYSLTWWPDEPDGDHEVPMSGHGHRPDYMLTLTNPRPIEGRRRDFDARPNHVEHRWMGGYAKGKASLTVEGWDAERVLKVYGERRAEWLNNRTLGMVWDSEKCVWTPGEVDA